MRCEVLSRHFTVDLSVAPNNQSSIVTYFTLSFSLISLSSPTLPSESDLPPPLRQRVVSRIGRVCKNDTGDRRGVWTTFVKARLNCSVAGEYPFYLDQVQSIHYLDRDEVLYATFSTPE